MFSLENESSFLEVYNIYRELCVNRNVAEIPFIVVGTQGEQYRNNTNTNKQTRTLSLSLFLAFIHLEGIILLLPELQVSHFCCVSDKRSL